MNTEQTVDKLAGWIKEQVTAAGCRGAVLGMSGGIDSSVVAALCQRALPGSTLGVIIPCHSVDEDREHALLVADKFSIPTKTVVLDAIFDALMGAIPRPDAGSRAQRLTESNVKVRLRMVTLYYFANLLNYLVVGSSNRSELTMGYFTKWGDGGVDILPIGNLVKQQVRELAAYLGVPAPVIQKPPSAGLWPGQTDEAEMGLTYAELDSYLLTGAGSPETIARLEARKRNSQHKRSLPPIAPL